MFLGVFHNTDIDQALTCAVVADTPKSPAPKCKRPMMTERVGTGKGRPLKPRKVHVSRQQRVQVKRGFNMSAFGGKAKVVGLGESRAEQPSHLPAAQATKARRTIHPHLERHHHHQRREHLHQRKEKLNCNHRFLRQQVVPLEMMDH